MGAVDDEQGTVPENLEPPRPVHVSQSRDNGWQG